MFVSQIMKRDVYTAHPWDTLASIRSVMRQHSIGFVPVVEDGVVVGVLTDRDLLMRGHQAEPDPERRRVADVMTRAVVACHDDDELPAVLNRMAQAHVRRLPVLTHSREARLVGIVSIDDLAGLVEDCNLVYRILKPVRRPTVPPNRRPSRKARCCTEANDRRDLR